MSWAILPSLPPRPSALVAARPSSPASRRLVLLPTHPVYLKRPRDESHAVRASKSPIPLQTRRAARSPSLLLHNTKHLLTSDPTAVGGAEQCQPHWEPPRSPTDPPHAATRGSPCLPGTSRPGGHPLPGRSHTPKLRTDQLAALLTTPGSGRGQAATRKSCGSSHSASSLGGRTWDAAPHLHPPQPHSTVTEPRGSGRERRAAVSPTAPQPRHSPPRHPAHAHGRSPPAPPPAAGPRSAPSHPGSLCLTFSGSEGFLTICIVKP